MPRISSIFSFAFYFLGLAYTHLALTKELLCKLSLTEEHVVTDSNYVHVAEALLQKLKNFLNAAELTSAFDSATLTRIDNMLEHVVQNTFQHGTGSMTSQIVKDNEHIFLSIKNPQIKSFPMALQREFEIRQSARIPDEQRVGYTGMSIGHLSIFHALDGLPKGSSIKWEVIDENVVFTLKLPLSNKNTQ